MREIVNINKQQRKTKILIVDDSSEAIDVLGNTLPKEYKRQIALCGEKALDILEASDELPELILLDVIMPGINGYEVCRRIKADVRFKDVPIIFISALNETFDKVKAFKMGAVDYITKPFQSEEVIARVGTHLKIAQSKKEIKDLYSNTFQAMIRAMNDMMAMANPEVSRISNAMRLYAEMITKELSIKESWDLKLACLLSGIGMLTEDIEKCETRYFANVNKTINSRNINIAFDINKAYDALSLSAQIVENIPKLEPIVEIINKSMLPLDKSNSNKPISALKSEVLKGHILRILIHYFYKIKEEKNYLLVLKLMKNYQEEYYSPEILDALQKVQNNLSSSDILELNIDELESKMILADDILTLEGKVLLKAGYELSESLIMSLKNFNNLKNMKKIRAIKKFNAII